MFIVNQNQLPVGDDDEDRKRIKERLKEAVESDKRVRARVVKTTKHESWLEYVFGICEPDRRMGKHGSRCVVSRLTRMKKVSSSFALMYFQVLQFQFFLETHFYELIFIFFRGITKMIPDTH